jgi:hypothetical protein
MILTLIFTVCLIGHTTRCHTEELQPSRHFDLGSGRQMDIPMTLAQCQTGQAQIAIAEWMVYHPGYALRGGWKCRSGEKGAPT